MNCCVRTLLAMEMDSIFCEIVVLVLLLSLLFLCFKNNGSQKGSKLLPTNWPFLGMLPWLLLNSDRSYSSVTDVLLQLGGSFEFKGPWFSGMEIFFTSDPANIRYILVKNFTNFPKGPDFNKIFDVLGDGIFNADSKLWEAQRRTAMSFLNHHYFCKFVMSTVCNKLESGLIPIVHKFAELGTVFDMQDLLQRFTFDTTCILVLGQDTNSLFCDVPEVKAFDDCATAVFYRGILPEFVWKVQRWLQIGNEKKLSEGSKMIRHFISPCISLKRQQQQLLVGQEEGRDLLTNYLMRCTDGSGSSDSCLDGGKGLSEKLFVDILLNFMFAGRDTISASISWLFWLLATNPHEQEKIHEELIANLGTTMGTRSTLFEFLTGDGAKERISRLVYLHGAACESLRLFPPVGFNHKAPREYDILPSGHKIKKNTKMLLSFYSMGRMESIWGLDCLEFKPGRWISEHTGQIKHEPSFKFTAFNSGPRTCLGKEMSFIQIKMVAASIIHGYHIEVVEGHPVSPSASVVLGMKHGLKVRVSKRRV